MENGEWRAPWKGGFLTGVTVFARGEVRPDVGTLYYPVPLTNGVSLLPEVVIEFADIQTEVMLEFGVGGGRVCSGLFCITEPYYHPSTNECDNVSTNDYGVIGGTNGTSSAGN